MTIFSHEYTGHKTALPLKIGKEAACNSNETRLRFVFSAKSTSFMKHSNAPLVFYQLLLKHNKRRLCILMKL